MLKSARTSCGLHSFPSEFFGELSLFVRSDEICRLLLCGCKALNYKMTCSSGVSTLIYRQSGTTKALPFVSQFSGLQRLRHVSGRPEELPITFPKLLSELSLEAINAEELWCRFCYSVRSIDQALPYMRSLSLNGNPYLRTDYLKACLPSGLVTLRLPTATLLERIAGLLPQNLTHFTTPRDMNFEYLSLPVTLESLDVHIPDMSDPWMIIRSPLGDGGILAHLSSLTELRISLPRLSAEGFRMLPLATLTRLHVEAVIEEELCEFLPPRLRYLGLKSTRYGHFSLAPRFLALLPRGLLGFATNAAFQTEEEYASLPRDLTSLSLGQYSFLCPKCAKALPPKLEELKGSGLFSSNTLNMSILPRGLTRLCLSSSRKDYVLVDLNSFRFAPPQIAYLDLGGLEPVCSLYWFTFLPTLTLRSINLHCVIALTDDCFSHFSKHHPQCFNMTEFSISNFLKKVYPLLPNGIREDRQKWHSLTLHLKMPELPLYNYNCVEIQHRIVLERQAHATHACELDKARTQFKPTTHRSSDSKPTQITHTSPDTFMQPNH